MKYLSANAPNLMLIGQLNGGNQIENTELIRFIHGLGRFIMIEIMKTTAERP